MKKLFTIVSVLLLAVAVQAENLIENASFEKAGKKAPAAWAKIGQGKITFQQGKGIVRLESPDEKTLTTCSARQSVFKKIVKGKKYLLQCKVKGDKFKPGAKYDYGLMLINKNWKGSFGTRRFKITETAPMTIKKVITVPAHWTDAIVVAFMANSTGALEFSELQLTEVQ